MLLIYSLLIKNGRRIISSTELFVQLTVYSKWRITQCCAEDNYLYTRTWLWFYMHVLHSTVIARCYGNYNSDSCTEWLNVVIHVYNIMIAPTQHGPINPRIERGSYRGKWFPMSHLVSLARRHGSWYPGGDPDMAGCLECPLTRPVLAQSWRQTATDGAWYLTTALPSCRNRPLTICVLKRRGYEFVTRWTGEWRPPPKEQPPRGTRW